MTRDAKIGLLLGLVFIISVGVVISHYFKGATRPPTPQASRMGPNVEQSLTFPGSRDQRQRDYTLVPDVPRGQLRTGEPVRPLEGPGSAGREVPRGGTVTPPAPRPEPIERTVSPSPMRDNPATRDHEGPEPPAGTVAYVAQPRDTVSGMARRFLGSSSVSAREQIIRLNPSLQANPDRVVVGAVYYVPDTSAPAPVAAGPQPEPIRPVPLVGTDRSAPPAPTPAVQAQDVATVLYTTQPGDSLWKIARDQCGNASSTVVDQIKALNADVLRGRETIHPNMQLKLPVRRVASR